MLLTAAPASAETIDDVIAAARGAGVVILGEIHDNPEHHARQAAIVAALAPAALVFEMLPQAAEDRIETLRDEGASPEAVAEAVGWEESGWPDFALYAPIFHAAPAARVFGAGQSPEDTRLAASEGAAEAFGPDAPAYGLDQPLAPADQAALEALLDASHCNMLPADRLPGMVEVQRFRDAGIADAALWARRLTGEGQVVVIAGSGHADRRHGVPAMLAIADPELQVFSLGQSEPGAPAEDTDAAAFDAVLEAPAPTREDPCAAFN